MSHNFFYCFNPSVGILFIQAYKCDTEDKFLCCFNPSVGILFIQAFLQRRQYQSWREFQSLGRDSVHSSPRPADRAASRRVFQSLGRDSVHSSRRSAGAGARIKGFQSLGRDSVHSSFVSAALRRSRDRFNPSVGILFIQATIPVRYGNVLGLFQSLGRDSVHSSFNAVMRRELKAEVSIPRSGFCSFKPYRSICIPFLCQVSIPRSGFCSFKP